METDGAGGGRANAGGFRGAVVGVITSTAATNIAKSAAGVPGGGGWRGRVSAQATAIVK